MLVDVDDGSFNTCNVVDLAVVVCLEISIPKPKPVLEDSIEIEMVMMANKAAGTTIRTMTFSQSTCLMDLIDYVKIDQKYYWEMYVLSS